MIQCKTPKVMARTLEVNNYKKPYFHKSIKDEISREETGFETPNKMKPKVKKHAESQQILETKQFLSEKKIDSNGKDVE